MSIPTDDHRRTYPGHRSLPVPDAPGTDVSACDSTPAARWNNGSLMDPGAVARLRLGLTRAVVVVAAHLDEELSGAGGLLASLATAGAELRVLALTDGDCDEAGGNAPGPPPRFQRRLARLERAYRLLGMESTLRYRLGLRCGTLADAGVDILAAISELLGFAHPPGLLCLAPWLDDTHPDHVAAGHAAMLACRAYHIRLLYYPVSGPHHPGAAQLPLHRARRFTLPEPLGGLKHQALAHLTACDHRPGRAHHPARPAHEVFIT